MGNISHPAIWIGEEPDRFWLVLRREASAAIKVEPLLSHLLDHLILRNDTFQAALTANLVERLHVPDYHVERLNKLVREAHADQPAIIMAAVRDLRASYDRNPAYPDHLTPFLYFKGFQVVQWQRISHWLWGRDKRRMAVDLHSRIVDAFGVDIHPGAVLGTGLFVDHAMSTVIGETAVIDQDVSILHDVTLGSTGKECGDRHPKIRRGAMIGAGARVLGNIEIGERAKIGAGSVVLKPVPAFPTAVGIPARVVRSSLEAVPA